MFFLSWNSWNILTISLYQDTTSPNYNNYLSDQECVKVSSSQGGVKLTWIFIYDYIESHPSLLTLSIFLSLFYMYFKFFVHRSSERVNDLTDGDISQSVLDILHQWFFSLALLCVRDSLLSKFKLNRLFWHGSLIWAIKSIAGVIRQRITWKTAVNEAQSKCTKFRLEAEVCAVWDVLLLCSEVHSCFARETPSERE